MAKKKTTIDTSSAEYMTALENLADLNDLLKPLIKLYRKMKPENRKKWIQRDPLLKKALQFSKKFFDLIGDVEDDQE